MVALPGLQPCPQLLGAPSPKRCPLWASSGCRTDPARGPRCVHTGGLSGNARLTPVCQTQREPVGAQRSLPGVSREQMDRPAVPRVLGEQGRAGRIPECQPRVFPPHCAPLHAPLPSLMFRPISGQQGSAGQGHGTDAAGPPSSTLVPAADGPAGQAGGSGARDEARVRPPTRP